LHHFQLPLSGSPASASGKSSGAKT
jgi:hypothetical protein